MDVRGANVRSRARAEHAPVDRLDHGTGVEVGVEPRVLGRERGFDGVHVLAREQLGRERHRDVVHLAEQSHLGPPRDRHRDGRHVGLGQQGASFRLQVTEQRVDRVEVQLVEHARQRGDELEADGRHEEPERRGRTRRGRNHDLAHPEDARDPSGVRGSGSAEPDHRVAPRIASLLDDVDAGRRRHALADDRVDAPRRLQSGQPERRGHTRHRYLRRRPVEMHAAAEEEVGIEVAEQQVGVGDRRLPATETVAGGSWIGPGASRAHLEQAELVHPSDAAAAGSDLDHVDHGRLDRQPAALLEAVDARGLHHWRHVGLAGPDEACLGGRAAHVERDHVAMSCLIAEKRRSQPAPGRARLQQSHGELARHAGRGRAPRGLHQGEAAAKAALGERVFQAGDVAVHQGLDVRVRGRRGAALVLAQLGHDLARERHRELGELAPQEVLYGALVGRVLVRMEEADGQGLHSSRDQVGDLAAHLVEVDRRDDHAVPGRPLVDLAPQIPEGQRLRELQKEVVDVIALLDAHLERVAEPPRREEPERCTRALDDGVGDQRRPVDELIDLREREPGGSEQLVQPLERTRRRVLRRGQALVDPDPPAHRVQQHEVGEGAPDVKADPIPIVAPRRGHWRPPK